MDKKRLLVVSQHYWPENFRVNDMVAGFIGNGIEVDVLCGLPNYPKGEWFAGYRYTGPRRQRHGGAQVFRAGEIRRKGNTTLRIFLNYASWPLLALFSLPRLPGGYDAVLCYETSPVLMLLPAIVYAKTHKTPLCCYVLDLWPDNLYSVLPVKSRFWRGVAGCVSRWHYRRCNRLIAMGGALAARLAEVTGAPGKQSPQIGVIPQYAEDFYAGAPANESLQKYFTGGFHLLFAGNISPAQDLDNLVRAMARVRKAPGGQDVKVLILGDGMSREALQKSIAEAGLQDAFTFCGAAPPQQVPQWAAHADALFAGLAKSENLGLTVPAKIPSYFAMGRPMLVADDGEGGRAALESGAALVSAAGDDAALAENILALRALPAEQRAAMGEAGRAFYRRHYRRKDLLAKLEAFILEGKQ